MKIIDMTLSRESFFSDELIPILRLPDNMFIDPSDIGMSGLRSFYEAFYFNLGLVANYSLYVGTDKLEISQLSLSILRKIANSKIFCDTTTRISSNLMKKIACL